MCSFAASDRRLGLSEKPSTEYSIELWAEQAKTRVLLGTFENLQ